MPLTIDRASQRSGCSPPTIRYYEDIGLLTGVGRSANGRRAYSWPQVHRLTFIRRARDLGLSIEQVRLLLEMSDGDPSDCAGARDLIAAQIETVRRKRAELESLEDTFARMAARCDKVCAADPAAACTVFADVLASAPAER